MNLRQDILILQIKKNDKKFISKKKKIEYFSDSDLNDQYYDKLKTHLYINTLKKQNYDINSLKDDLIVDLSLTNILNEEIDFNNSSQELNLLKFKDDNDKKEDSLKLLMPKMA